MLLGRELLLPWRPSVYAGLGAPAKAAVKREAQGGRIRPPEPAHSDLQFEFRLDRPLDGVAAARVAGEEASAVATSREEVLGEPLEEEEVAQLVERNGVYVNVVDRVREAFKTVEVVRLDCSHVGSSDCKKTEGYNM
ncbi:hypothetical protein ABZP36_030863 [Zizania latifolia]